MSKPSYSPVTPADVGYKEPLPEKCIDCVWRREWVCSRVVCVKEVKEQTKMWIAGS